MHDLLLYAGIAVGWLVLFVGAVCILAYRRASLALSTGMLLLLLALYWALGTAPNGWKVLVSIPFAVLFLFNIRPLRRRLVTRPFMKKYRKLLPAMSSTEREALDAGTVWWDGELFTGGPAKTHVGESPGTRARGAGFFGRTLRRAVCHAR
jgi:acyl-CoA dehydrogenase